MASIRTLTPAPATALNAAATAAATAAPTAPTAPTAGQAELRKRCFDPVVDARTRVLVLGSLPGERSLAMQEYYGNRQNRFWHLMAAVTGADLVPLANPQRLATLLKQGVGLWDVVAEASRPGSLDSNIRDHSVNDLWALLDTLPALSTIAFNGGTAAKLGLKTLGERAARYRIVTLPSSSPAHTLRYADKLAQWMALAVPDAAPVVASVVIPVADSEVTAAAAPVVAPVAAPARPL